MTRFSGYTMVSALSGLLLAACQTPPRVIEPAVAPSASPGDTGRGHDSPADVVFLHGMIAHHAQALAMTNLLPTRTRRDDLRLFAKRIDVSQRDETSQMQRWLRDHRQSVPSADAAHVHHVASGHHAMPGMLTEAEMARLTASNGPEFDRLFLELMIRHHEGAVTMVKQLFTTSGAAQDSAIYQLATDIDADQRAEIARMRALLVTMPTP